jgi:Tfp pilus assembly protein PilX
MTPNHLRLKPLNKRREQGAALIVTVLTMTVLIAVLLAVSTQVTLSTRSSTADRRDTVRAQYAAESGLSVARTQLGDIQRMFTGDVTASGTVKYIVLPKTTKAADLLALANAYCGAGTSWTVTSAPGVFPVQYLCTAAGASANTDSRYQVLVQYVNPAILPPTFAQQLGKNPPSSADLLTFWNQAFGAGINVNTTQGSNSVSVAYRLQPTRVIRRNNTSFQFFFQVVDVSSTGTSGRSTRVVKANSTTNSEFYFTIELPTFVDRVLFTNHHRNRAGSLINFTTQVFDGPVHTNERFVFAAGATAQFKGAVTSAGCYDFNVDACDTNTNNTDKVQPGLYVGSSLFTLGASQGGLAGTAVNSLPNLTAKVPAGTTFSSPPNWSSEFQPLPQNAEDQAAAANADGLVIPNGATVTLAASTSGTAVVSPLLYNPLDKVWTPTPTYQFITVASGGTTTIYRANSAGLLEEKQNNVWVQKRANFNGVLYSPGDGAAGSTGGNITVTGPARVGLLAPPALAGFSQMTLAAEDNIDIQGDLTYSDVPCKSPDACTSKTTPLNLLGIYAQKGDVRIGTSAPANVNIHGVLMSSEGEVSVTGYNTGTARGTLNLLGGLIEDYYGAFGTFNPANPTVLGTGYGRNFSFDQRMSEGVGMTPPYFPLSPKWLVKSGTDDKLSLTNLTWQQGTK